MEMLVHILGTYPREMKLVLTQNLYMNVHSYFVCNGLKLKRTETPFNNV